MSSLDRKHKAGLGGEAALLVVLIIALVGVPEALYGLNTLGHQLEPRPDGIPTGCWPRSLGNFTASCREGLPRSRWRSSPAYSSWNCSCSTSR